MLKRWWWVAAVACSSSTQTVIQETDASADVHTGGKGGAGGSVAGAGGTAAPDAASAGAPVEDSGSDTSTLDAAVDASPPDCFGMSLCARGDGFCEGHLADGEVCGETCTCLGVRDMPPDTCQEGGTPRNCDAIAGNVAPNRGRRCRCLE